MATPDNHRPLTLEYPCQTPFLLVPQPLEGVLGVIKQSLSRLLKTTRTKDNTSFKPPYPLPYFPLSVVWFTCCICHHPTTKKAYYEPTPEIHHIAQYKSWVSHQICEATYCGGEEKPRPVFTLFPSPFLLHFPSFLFLLLPTPYGSKPPPIPQQTSPRLPQWVSREIK